MWCQAVLDACFFFFFSLGQAVLLKDRILLHLIITLYVESIFIYFCVRLKITVLFAWDQSVSKLWSDLCYFKSGNTFILSELWIFKALFEAKIKSKKDCPHTDQKVYDGTCTKLSDKDSHMLNVPASDD